eukprot:1204314-Prymnesium_polylepis.1
MALRPARPRPSTDAVERRTERKTRRGTAIAHRDTGKKRYPRYICAGSGWEQPTRPSGAQGRVPPGCWGMRNARAPSPAILWMCVRCPALRCHVVLRILSGRSAARTYTRGPTGRASRTLHEDMHEDWGGSGVAVGSRPRRPGAGESPRPA